MYNVKNKSSEISCPPSDKCPAKTFTDEENNICPGRSVENHCEIVGLVAQELISRYPPTIQKLFPKGSALVAAAHDIGKISPTFVKKIQNACHPSAWEKYWNGEVPQIDRDPNCEMQWGGHAGVSEATLKQHLRNEGLKVCNVIGGIVGQHHGFSPKTGLNGKGGDCDIFGGENWYKERVKLSNHLSGHLKEIWPLSLSVADIRLISGLTSVADWIGSGEQFENPTSDVTPQSIRNAVNNAGFYPIKVKQALSFEAVFGFSPNSCQQSMIEHIQGPGVYVLEAPMGIGKTEAALIAAYECLQKGVANGIYFALPTQLTSNKIYERFIPFLQKILDPSYESTYPFLMHGNAHLVQDSFLANTEWGEEAKPGGTWFDSRKRRILAPFAVGTIDQALMAVLNVKHGFVRAFGLAGKIVIFDEVHTYDAYMGTLLKDLIGLLEELGCTVIILSATLNSAKRQELLNIQTPSSSVLPYPLLSIKPNLSGIQEVGVDTRFIPQKKVSLSFRDRSVALQEALQRAQIGQQVLWLENTVSEAQTTFQDLVHQTSSTPEFKSIEVGLLHSKFIFADRARIEKKWIDVLGKSSQNRKEKGRILVGTQVLEQSIDVDADFLVTALAPTDMLLQRMGRLWRHSRIDRGVDQCSSWILNPKNTEKDLFKGKFGLSQWVYAPYVLERSHALLKNQSTLCLPGDIRGLIEDTYQDRIETGILQAWKSEWLGWETNHGIVGQAVQEKKAQRSISKDGLVEGIAQDEQVSTRYSTRPTCSVLLFRNYKRTKEGVWLELLKQNSATGQRVFLPQKRHDLSKKEWRDLALMLQEQTIVVEMAAAPDWRFCSKTHLESLGLGSLGNCFYLQDGEGALRIGLVDTKDEIRDLNGERVCADKKEVFYSSLLGYYKK